MSLISAYQIAITAAGIFFFNALLTGVWKYRQMAKSKEAQAHAYVDISHRASLMYSFAALLIAQFVQISQLSANIELLAASLPLLYFALAIISYMVQGFAQKTDNQLLNAPAYVHWFMWSLIIAEIGGFVVLFYGVLVAIY